MKALAQELIDAILGELEAVEATENHRDRERKGLKSCSLVARNFRGASQRRLFRSASVGSVPKVMAGFAHSPRLLSYVRDLRVFVRDGPNTDYPDYDSLASILQLLSGIQELLIISSTSWYLESSPSFRIALHSVLSRPSLRCLGFQCPTVPSAIILHALSSCKAVALDTFQLIPSEKPHDTPLDAGDEWPPPALTVTVDRLFLRYLPTRSLAVHDLLLTTSAQKCLHNLRAMTIELLGSGSLYGLEKVVIQCLSLQHLVLDFNMFLSRQDRNAPPFPLPIIPTLRLLTFKAVMTEIRVPNSLMSAIPTLPTCTPKLEVLTFHLGGDWEKRPRGMTEQSQADEALTTLPHLVEAHFIVHTDGCIGRLARSVRAQLPLSSDAGLLCFSHTRFRGTGWHAEYFSDPDSALLVDLSETWESDESADDDWSDYSY
ncbi:hypothetical protein MVEN_01452400 [Mycena venus]|uniref:Uncharacterized protein n=1 Tax=Mycena venus TaxID=2733690 RepID=A0A8H6XS11_9AGAR|nr:hypothetical protein MVEN_01452400 [Mycena venus]